jgi:hypothetical protein
MLVEALIQNTLKMEGLRVVSVKFVEDNLKARINRARAK